LKTLIALLLILAAVAVASRAATVTEIYTRPVAVKGAPIRAPLRMLPPMPERPTPPTPEEIADAQALAVARAEFSAARDAYLVKLGFVAATNTVHLRADTARLNLAASKIAAEPAPIQKETR